MLKTTTERKKVKNNSTYKPQVGCIDKYIYIYIYIYISYIIYIYIIYNI